MLLRLPLLGTAQAKLVGATNYQPRTTNHEPRTTNHQPPTSLDPSRDTAGHGLARRSRMPRSSDTRRETLASISSHAATALLASPDRARISSARACSY